MGSPELTNISKLVARPDPMLSFKWVIPAGFVCATDTGNVLPTEFVESIDIPFNNVKVDGMFTGGGYTYFPSFHDISAFTVNFYMDRENITMSWLAAWKNKVKDFNTGLYGLPSVYKGSVTVHLLDSKNNGILEVSLLGIWPADTNQITLDSENNKLVISQNFSIDGQSIKSLSGRPVSL